jgi:hypothetical protein
MADAECGRLTLPARGYAAALEKPRWWEKAAMQSLAGGGAVLGYARGPGKDAPAWAFLASDITAAPFRAARRLMGVFRKGPQDAAVVSLDFAAPAGPCCRQFIEVGEAPRVRGNTFESGAARHTVLLPGGEEAVLETAEGAVLASAPKGKDDAVFLHVAQFGRAAPVELIWEIDLAGVRMGRRVALFHPGSRVVHQPVFFHADGGDSLECLVGGLAPGSWDVWWNGWLEQPDLWVAPEECALYFEGPPGGYYLRRRGGND